MAARKLLTIAIAGNPNCGKTALFNALTGARQHVGNWPGVTVEKKEGYFELGDRQIRLVDLPGTYALFANAEDERAAVDYLLSREASLIINIVDATNLERNLFLTSQLADMKIPMVIAVNMMDIAENRGIQLDLDELSNFYGVPCIPLSAVSEKSVTNFISQMGHVLASPMPLPKQMVYGDKVEEAVKVLEPKVAPVAKLLDADARWVSLMYLGNEKSYADKIAEAGVKLDKAEVVKILGEEPEFAMAENRYSISHEVAGKATVSVRSKKTFSDKLDAVLLNRWAALPIFLVIMYLVFWIAVTIGSAFIDFFDVLFGAIFVDGLGYLLGDVLGCPSFVTAVLADGIGAGIQTVSTFIPVIFFMFLCLSFLEDSGYMARAAFVADRFMRFLGLPGRAFVPMMVGFGCGVPAIMGTRVLESKRERFLTIFLVPFMSCGARLPVYALFAAAFFGKMAGTVVFLLYLTGVLFAIAYGLFLKRSLFQGQASNFVMELPPYHLPKFKSLMIHCWQRLRDYIWRAGKVITLAVAVLGFLNSFGIVEKMYVDVDGTATEIVQAEDGYQMVKENEEGETENVALPDEVRHESVLRLVVDILRCPDLLDLYDLGLRIADLGTHLRGDARDQLIGRIVVSIKLLDIRPVAADVGEIPVGKARHVLIRQLPDKVTLLAGHGDAPLLRQHAQELELLHELLDILYRQLVESGVVVADRDLPEVAGIHGLIAVPLVGDQDHRLGAGILLYLLRLFLELQAAASPERKRRQQDQQRSQHLFRFSEMFQKHISPVPGPYLVYISITMPTTTPRIAPAQTCSGVCPTSSFRLFSRTSPSHWKGFSSRRAFKTLACLPVSSRTPMASCITMIASTALMANSKECIEYRKNAAVASEQTVAEWELGMPPEPIRRSGTKRCSNRSPSSVLMICASDHPMTTVMIS
mgnify:CR=1 FL=1